MRLTFALLLFAGCGATGSGDDTILDFATASGDMAAPPGSDLTMRPVDLAGADLLPPPLGYTQSVTVYVEPTSGSAPILSAIKSAASSIHVEVYLITDNAVLSALTSAHSNGLDVKVIVDQNPMGGSNANAVSTLQGAGVPFMYGNPAFTYTHEKAIILDGKTLLAMTGNLSAAAYSQNREYILVDTDPADVAEAEAVFEADWGRTTPQIARLTVSPINSRGHIDSVINAATQELDVEWEELSDNDVGFHLQSRAKAGVAVKVIAPSSAAQTTLTLLSSIKAGGVQVRLLNSPYVHAKMLLVDRQKGFIGSENATSTSLNNNRELGVTWQNATVAQKVGSTFDSDWANATPY